jgi:hypothetical protein
VPWWSTRTSRHLVEFAAQLLLELLPVEAVVLVAAGYSGQDITEEPIPFWFLLGTFLLASGLGRYLIGIRLQRLLVISSPLFVLSALLLIRISPALYGSSGNGFFDWSWMYSFGGDFANHTALPALLLLLAYIWWRGLKLGGDPPDYSMVMRRFKYGMIVIVAVTIASIGVPPALQPHVVGVLGFILPAEVFAGLVAAALGRMALNQAEHRVDAYLRTNDRLWLGTSLGLALAAIGFALVINLILNYQSIGSLLALLGPIGTITNKLATLLVNGLAQLLRFLFDWLIGLIHPLTSKPTVKQPSSPNPNGKHHSKAPPIPSQWLDIARIVLEVAALILVIVLFLWLMRKIVTHQRPHEEILDEERESLDATSIFSSQLRAFLAGLRPARAAAWVDPLVPGSVRYLYRGFLETAGKRGMVRSTSETPDEYRARLSTNPALGGPEPQEQDGRGQLEVLNEAYNSTRYAERPPTDQEMPDIRRVVKSLVSRLER